MTGTDFENLARSELIKALSENSTGNAKSLVGSYLSQLRRFRLFLSSDGNADQSATNQEKTAIPTHIHKRKTSVIVPDPSNDQVEFYLEKR